MSERKTGQTFGAGVSKTRTNMNTSAVLKRIQPGRPIEGISAMLLPFDRNGKIDFAGFSDNVRRTFDAGLVPAVNMDTGYSNLLSVAERKEVLKAAQEAARGKRFVAGAFVEGLKGDLLNLYQTEFEGISAAGATPILFQCSEFKKMSGAELVGFHKSLAAACTTLICFELGDMFAPFGQVYDLGTVRELMEIPQIIGMKHSSLNRELEWERLALRDETRPEFKIYTGNDLAIDMVMYGSDYLLGLSAFAPEAFAVRDAMWAKSDPRFYELNDLLQYLGCFAFRAPVPAYKHSAAQFLKIRGRIKCDQPHPDGQRRPESDVEILRDISARLDALEAVSTG
jgi:dihydrodipicolinate synthase/N-acetylneuraminate lyase